VKYIAFTYEKDVISPFKNCKKVKTGDWERRVIEK
jgi:hypothetical protein